MSEFRRYLDYLADIQEAIDRVLEYTHGLSWEEYLQDRKTQDALVRNLEVLGEATKISRKASAVNTRPFRGVIWLEREIA